MGRRAAWWPGRGPYMSSSEVVVVTIEGSLTPSEILPRGVRRTVRLTPTVQDLIDRGFVTVTERRVVQSSS